MAFYTLFKKRPAPDTLAVIRTAASAWQGEVVTVVACSERFARCRTEDHTLLTLDWRRDLAAYEPVAHAQVWSDLATGGAA
jgi:hypothetical protein